MTAPIVLGMKRCNGCSEWKPLSFYVKNKSRCRSCLNADRKKWADDNPQAIQKYRNNSKSNDQKRSRNYRTHPRNRAKVLFLAARTRAIKSNLDFDLTEDYVYTLMVCQNFKCAQTKIPFDFSNQNGKRLLCGPSIDRKDQNGGYLKSNIQIVCWFYNAAKGTFTDADIWALFNRTHQNRELI